MNEAAGKAKDILSGAEALLITAGAGIGVDSGLPDFRGNEGFWKAYPPYQRLGMSFVQMANPDNFHTDPAFGWGFYGHRLNLYCRTKPHAGFAMLCEFAEKLPGGSFVFTSNVDGHFQEAGFLPEQVAECHGSIRHLQCFHDCRDRIWSADGVEIEIDETTMRAREPLPMCPDCGGVARPNILMFGDWGWNPTRTNAQEDRLKRWLREVSNLRLVVFEFGAGSAVPTVRMQSERVARLHSNAALIRVNPREPEIPAQMNAGVSLPCGALEAIRQLLIAL